MASESFRRKSASCLTPSAMASSATHHDQSLKNRERESDKPSQRLHTEKASPHQPTHFTAQSTVNVEHFQGTFNNLHFKSARVECKELPLLVHHLLSGKVGQIDSEVLRDHDGGLVALALANGQPDNKNKESQPFDEQKSTGTSNQTQLGMKTLCLKKGCANIATQGTSLQQNLLT